LALLFKTDTLRWLTIGGLGLEVAQLALLAYLVTALNQELGFSLLAAGTVLSAAQVAGVAGRLFWGWAADRIGDGLALLIALSLWSTITFGTVSLTSAGWPPLGIATLFVLTALAVMGWFGVYLAEVARLSPPGMVATVTGANLAVITIAAFGGPAMFAGFYALTGSYTTCFGLLALACAASAWTILKTRRLLAATTAETRAP
jgi:nitrate/nitrite transporter NarK